MENKYRIVENQSGFVIQKQVLEYRTIGMFPFAKRISVKVWRNLSDNNFGIKFVSIPKIYNSLEEAKKAVEKIKMYPIYHYI